MSAIRTRPALAVITAVAMVMAVTLVAQRADAVGGAPDAPGAPGAASAGRASAGFAAAARPVPAALRARMRGVSWHPGCPVPLDDLRLVTLRHWTFDGAVQAGRLVVHRDAVDDIVAAFQHAFAARFPVRSMRPVHEFGGSDFASIEANNTSAFNCRRVAGTTRWSRHAYGRAIDINPIENPYVNRAGRVAHAASVPYLDRSRPRPGMAVEGSAIVAAFDAVGWGWGGRWISVRDYQHFSRSGR